jgi:curved DNA-binding protein CbpA
MEKRNFYETLAVPMQAAPAEIYLAYQRLVSRINPDDGARPDAERFREVQNAYRTLSDPGRRRAHDIELSMGRLPFSAELPRWKAPVIIPDDFLTISPSFEALSDHISQNFLGFHRKSAGPLGRLAFDGIVDRDDLRFGCYLPVKFFKGWPRIFFEIPRDTHEGERFEKDLGEIGISNLTLQVRVVVVSR